MAWKVPLAICVFWAQEDEKTPNHKAERIARDIHAALSQGELDLQAETTNEEGQTSPLGPFPRSDISVPVLFGGTADPSVTFADALRDRQPADTTVAIVLVDVVMGAHPRHDKWAPVMAHFLDDERWQFIPWGLSSGAFRSFAETQRVLTRVVDEQSLDRLFVQLIKMSRPRGFPRVFLSHSKKDGEQVAIDLKAAIAESVKGVQVWLDKDEIHAGDLLEGTIKRQLTECLFVAVLTRTFVGSSWTRLETIEARENNQVVVVVDALEGAVRRITPELANAPVLRWPASSVRVSSVLLSELLRHTIHELSVMQTARDLQMSERKLVPVNYPPGPAVSTADSPQPEVRIYSDPPLPIGELAYYASSNQVQFRTLSQFVVDEGWRSAGGASAKLGAEYLIGLSSSWAKEASRTGLGSEHFDDLSAAVTRAVIHLGGRLAYGGDLRPGGTTRRMAEIVSSHSLTANASNQMRPYVPWPMWRTWSEDDFEDRREFSNPRKEMPHPMVPVPHPMVPKSEKESWTGEELGAFLSSPEGRMGFALSLTSMRNTLVRDCTARVAAGGPVKGYMGRYPGVLEEVWLSLCNTQQPVYLLAGFGGAASAAYQLINGETPEVLTLEYQQTGNPSYARLWADLSATEEAIDWTGLCADLRKVSMSELARRSGLTVDEYQQLASTVNLIEIVYLLGKGLHILSGADA